MLVKVLFRAVTNALIDACAAVVSGLMVRVVGVLAADACNKFKVTPVMAPLATLLALVAA